MRRKLFAFIATGLFTLLFINAQISPVSAAKNPLGEACSIIGGVGDTCPKGYACGGCTVGINAHTTGNCTGGACYETGGNNCTQNINKGDYFQAEPDPAKCKNGLTCQPAENDQGNPIANVFTCQQPNTTCKKNCTQGETCTVGQADACAAGLNCQNINGTIGQCVPQAANGITPSPTQIPPISPPCAAFNAQGSCLSFDTALGKVGTDIPDFITAVFGTIVALSGGVALLSIIYAGYRFMTSQGKPEALQQAREQLIAAIVGLLFIIFSMVILQAIGIDILHIPGLNP